MLNKVLANRIIANSLLLLLAIHSTQLRAEERHSVAPGKPVIDGKVDEIWNTAREISTGRVVADLTTLDKQHRATAKVRLLWGREHIYLLAEVSDNNISTRNGNHWAQDSIEIYFDENRARTSGLQQDDSQYRISAVGDISVGGFGSANRVDAKVVPMTGGYRIEAAFKCHTPPLKSGRKMGLEIQVNDDPGTGQRESVAKWNHDGNDAWHSTENYGTLILVDELPDEPAESEKQTEAKLSAYNSDRNRKLTLPALNDRDEKANRFPEWAADAIFYQLFPERFRNGDPSNDPTRESLEFPEIIPQSWSTTKWTQQWYQRDDWERELGDDFYEHGVFHRRYGGDLAGVIEKLDYLQRLGINTIYFNPVFYARSLHKYDGNSFHHIDPHFGPDPAGDFKIMASESADPSTWKWTAADKLFLELLKQAHGRNIRVVIDGVFNHSGRDFFAFADVVKNQQQSLYKDWYIVERFDDPATPENEFKYKGWWGVETLPEFADTATGDDLAAAPKAYIFEATSRWMDPNGDGDPSDGIDGWRLDVAGEVPNKFWRDWNRHVLDINPEAYTVAEIWEGAGDYLEDCGFSATMNYHGFAFPVKGFLIDGTLPTTKFAEMIVERANEHRAEVMFVLQNLVDSHDTDRVASMIANVRIERPYKDAGRFDYDVTERVSARSSAEYDVDVPGARDRKVQKLVSLFQMTFVGAPMIYYGTEAGMDGADDPDDRMPMVWDDLEYEPRTLGPRGPLYESREIKFDQSLFDWYRQLAEMRSQHAALRRGSFEAIVIDDARQLFVFGRQLRDDRVLVVLNRGGEAATIELEASGWLADANSIRPVLSSRGSGNVSVGSTDLNFDDDSLAIEVGALEGQVWLVNPDRDNSSE